MGGLYPTAEGEVPPDFSEAWELGFEHVVQEGSPLEGIRAAYGLTRIQVEEMSGGRLPHPIQELLEDYPGLPEVDQLADYARIFSSLPLAEAIPGRPAGRATTWTPGSLLDRLILTVGEALLAEREADKVAEAHERETT